MRCFLNFALGSRDGHTHQYQKTIYHQVPKLIIDQDSLAAIFVKLQSEGDRPISWGLDEKMLAPGIIELDDASSKAGQWQPYSERTRLLMLGVDACYDIILYKDQLIKSVTRQRAVRGMTVQLCKLIDAVLDLVAKMNDEQSRSIRESWPRQDQILYRDIVKKLKNVQHKSSMRIIRNKLGAHLDIKIFDNEQIPRIELSDILNIFGNIVILLMISMNYPSTWFNWIRLVEEIPDDNHRVIEAMFQYPLCVRWITDIDGHIKEMERMTVAEDPRHEIGKKIFEITDNWNETVQESGLQPIRLSFVRLESVKKGTAPETCLVLPAK